MQANKPEVSYFTKFIDMVTDPDNIPIVLLSISKKKFKGYGDITTNIKFDKETIITILRDVIKTLEHENLSTNN